MYMEEGEGGVRKYRPSNGTEGAIFQSQYCDRCEKDREGREKQEGGCQILCRTLFLDLTDPDYPEEWTFDKDGKALCAAFEKARE